MASGTRTRSKTENSEEMKSKAKKTAAKKTAAEKAAVLPPAETSPTPPSPPAEAPSETPGDIPSDPPTPPSPPAEAPSEMPVDIPSDPPTPPSPPAEAPSEMPVETSPSAYAGGKSSPPSRVKLPKWKNASLRAVYQKFLSNSRRVVAPTDVQDAALRIRAHGLSNADPFLPTGIQDDVGMVQRFRP